MCLQSNRPAFSFFAFLQPHLLLLLLHRSCGGVNKQTASIVRLMMAGRKRRRRARVKLSMSAVLCCQAWSDQLLRSRPQESVRSPFAFALARFHTASVCAQVGECLCLPLLLLLLILIIAFAPEGSFVCLCPCAMKRVACFARRRQWSDK